MKARQIPPALPILVLGEGTLIVAGRGDGSTSLAVQTASRVTLVATDLTGVSPLPGKGPDHRVPHLLPDTKQTYT